MMNELTKGLTKDQQMAVDHTEGPIMVIAGAGTGKTTVITRRIVNLIQKELAKPGEILALTFTEKAAAEMLARVDEISNFLYTDLSISTFHSFGSEIIAEFSFELGLPADYRVLTDIEQILFIKDRIFEFKFNHFQNLSDPTSLIKELVSAFSRAKDEGISPDDYIKEAKRLLKVADSSAAREEAEKYLEVANAYETYEDLIRSEGYIDYGDQIRLVLELLKKPSCREKIKNRYKYALVDEFQDTNFTQNKLIFEIFGKNGNVMVVGDDDQSIYKFRGANIANIMNFKEQYAKVQTVVLKDNFRSTQSILDLAYGVIQNNNPERLEAKYDIDKKLISHKGSGRAPELLLFDTETNEAHEIAEQIKEKIKEGTPYGEIAILVRGNKHGEEFARTLRSKGIPVSFSGSGGLYEKQEVKMLVSLVSALYNPEDDIALYHLANSDVYNMDATELSRVARWSAHRNIPLLKVFSDLEPLAAELELTSNTTHLAERIIGDLTVLREETKTSTAGEIVNLFLKQSGYYSKLTKEARDGSIEAHTKISNIAAFFDKIIHFQRNYRDHSLEKFGQYLDLILEAGDDPKSSDISEGLDTVNILTMHKSKGLEFDYVFIASMSQSHMPGSNRTYEKFPLPPNLRVAGEIDSNPQAEERRLFYVAATRARKELYVSAALDYGTKRTHAASIFIKEAFGESKIDQKFLKMEPIERIKHFEKVGSLRHLSFEKIPGDLILELSRAEVDDYLTCPFKYQLVHITPIRIVAEATVSYGNAIHNTIGEYYKRRMQDKPVKKAELLDWFETFWDSAGFLSKTHEEKRYEHGRKALGRFYDKQEREPMPSQNETPFKFKIGNNIIRGRYDAIFSSERGTSIVDFKTSNIKTQLDADKKTKESKQLATYALAWFKNHNQVPDSVHLYYVETGLVGQHQPTLKQIEKTEAELEKACDGIRSREFEATPNIKACGFCPYKFYCPDAVTEKVAT